MNKIKLSTLVFLFLGLANNNLNAQFFGYPTAPTSGLNAADAVAFYNSTSTGAQTYGAIQKSFVETADYIDLTISNAKYDIRYRAIFNQGFYINEFLSTSATFDRIQILSYTGNFGVNQWCGITAQCATGSQPVTGTQGTFGTNPKIIKPCTQVGIDPSFVWWTLPPNKTVNHTNTTTGNIYGPNGCKFSAGSRISFHTFNDLPRYPGQAIGSQCQQTPFPIGSFSCTIRLWKYKQPCNANDAYLINSDTKQVAQGYTMQLAEWFYKSTNSTVRDVILTKPSGAVELIPISNLKYTFNELGSYRLNISINTNGTTCFLPPIYIYVNPCSKCLVDASKGNEKGKFLCFDRNLVDIPALKFDYQCGPNRYTYSYLDAQGNKTLGPWYWPVELGIENSRPACNSQAGLGANMRAIKYLMPKSSGASQKMNYVILTSKPFLIGEFNYQWRNITNVDQAAGTTKLLTQYKPSPNANWVTASREDLQSNMARSPGTPNGISLIPPTHQYFTLPNSFGNNNWTDGVIGFGIDNVWTEKAYLGSQVEVNCRTFTRPLKENSNVLYRVRVCNPCTFLGFFGLPETTFEVSGNINYSPSTKKGENASLFSGSGKVYTHIKSVPEMLNCTTPNTVSAVALNELEGNCTEGSNVSRGLNTNLESENPPMNLISGEELKKMFPSEVKQKIKLFMAPNPVENILTAELHNEKAGIVNYTILSIGGTVVLKGNFNCTEGVCRETINTSILKAGTYILNIVTNDKVITRKFIKL
jgi:Secretion system C-terminal sorting domain